MPQPSQPVFAIPYRVALLLGSGDVPVRMADALTVALRWVAAKESLPGIDPPHGTTALPSGSTVTIETHESSSMSLVGFRYLQVGNIRWRTELGLMRKDDQRTHVCIAVHSEAPPGISAPRVRRPRLIQQYFSQFPVSAGTRLPPVLQRIDGPHEVRELVATVGDPRRELPVVACTSDPYSEAPLLDAKGLHEWTLGLAHVVYLTKQAGLRLNEELQRLTGSAESARRWSVYNGAVRIYWPGIDVSANQRKAFEHRRWMPEEIERDPAAVVEAISTILLQAAQTWRAEWTDITTVNRVRRDEDMRALRARLDRIRHDEGDANVFAEYASTMENQRDDFRDQLEAALRTGESRMSELSSLERERGELAEQLERLREQSGRAERRCKELEAKIQEQSRVVEESLRVWKSLSTLPTCLAEVLDIVGAAFPRVLFTEDAKASARKAALSTQFPAALPEAWQFLWTLAEVLPSVWKQGGDIATEFQQRTGYEFAMTEGKQTRNNHKLVRERLFTFRGNQLSMGGCPVPC